MKQKPMFERMADDIADAVTNVVDSYSKDIKRRKCSKHLIWYWISEGANRARKNRSWLR